MAPNRGPSKPTRGGKGGSSAGRKPTGVSKSRISKKPSLPPPKQQKTKSASSKLKSGAGKKKQRVYTEKELGLPKLNMITPVGVEAPRGKKRGKVFVDDPHTEGRLIGTGVLGRREADILYLEQESMMTILAIVNADKEGQIESKMIKSRRMEEIRELRKAETEKREQMKKGKLEEKKDSLRKKRKAKDPDGVDVGSKSEVKPFKQRKRVSFG
ncbi:60S ribosomal subunit assembly/export protein [Trapelia coarctata]|nr:60S ribosomal subunit assembly/export protein [Trapelia coarctata]